MQDGATVAMPQWRFSEWCTCRVAVEISDRLTNGDWRLEIATLRELGELGELPHWRFGNVTLGELGELGELPHWRL